MKKLPDDFDLPLAKRNRLLKKSFKRYRIVHESGRSTKLLWRLIVERAKGHKTKKD